MTDYDSLEDHRVKHLEMIQSVIGRLGNDSFLVKGWTITVAGVFYGFAIQTTNWKLAAASAAPTLAFWILDVYFLRAERLFRALHDHVRQPTSEIEPFFMNATSSAFITMTQAKDNSIGSWWGTAWRPTLSFFYLALLVFAGIVVVTTA